MAKDTGGSAFPHDEYSTQSEQFRAMNYQESGMTLRDYFAAKAMAAMFINREGVGSEWPRETEETLARRAYSMADAMLAERSK